MSSAGGRSRRLLLWAPVTLTLGYEIYLSSQSTLPGIAIPISHLDKLAHAAYFFLMAALAVRAARFGEGWSARKTALVVVLSFALYGIADEYHQSFVPHRDVEAGDVLADTLGALLAALFAERLWVRAGLEQ